MKKGILIILTILLGLISCRKNSTINRVPGKNDNQEDTTTSTKLDICSFNLRYYNTEDPYPWSVRKGPVMKFVKDARPDFVGLQEIRWQQGLDIEASLTDDYYFYNVDRDSGNSVCKGEGAAVGLLFKKRRFSFGKKDFFWLSESPDKKPERNSDGTYSSWHSKYRRIVTWCKVRDRQHDNQEIYFFTTHFDHISLEAKRKSSHLIVEKIKEITGVGNLKSSQIPIFLVGDFNLRLKSNELTPVLNNMNEARTSADKTDDGTTYNGFNDDTYRVIDHIMYVGPVHPDAYEIVTKNYGVKYISDHYPIILHCSYK